MVTRGFKGRRPPAELAVRLPPGRSPTADFPVLSADPAPHIDTANWGFTLKVAMGAICTERFGGA